MLGPDFLDLPALHLLRVARPEDVRRLGLVIPGLRPFDELMLARRLRGDGSFVARFDPNPSAWMGADWFDPATGERVRILTMPEDWGDLDSRLPKQEGPRAELVVSVRDFLRTYRNTPEPTMAGPDGSACGKGTRGLLHPRPVRVIGKEVGGKESWRIEERRAQWRIPEGFRQVFAPDPGRIERVAAVLATMSEAELEAAGLSARTARDLRSGAPHLPRTLALAERVALDHATRGLDRRRLGGATADQLLIWYLEGRRCLAPGCPRALSGRRRSWCDVHADYPGALRRQWREGAAS